MVKSHQCQYHRDVCERKHVSCIDGSDFARFCSLSVRAATQLFEHILEKYRFFIMMAWFLNEL